MIRLLTPADAPLYRAIRLEALAAHPEAFTSTFEREQEKPLAWFEERLTTSDVFGTFIADELVGTAGFRREDGAKIAHKAVLWGMYVRPGARKSGTARLLVDAVAAHAAQRVEQLHLAVVSENLPALRLYAAAGFVEYGRGVKALKHNGRYYDETLMALFFDPEIRRNHAAE
ncbi:MULTISPECIES: GNAT family N-acetyltransferase [unclassified Bradyrhizobium]|uniref:GNAT family N-acetyltransferase n=1 Tax=unclassified Bradyrhizobium TaxID=2631580 RepID=UPI0020B1E6FD|nr:MULTISPECIES: GNAT family N-acetyltransferase [unclassified Bradyrhizobium]MCP3385176.1 GNAT family N-acetyltransferase [Bradyrhizobium sp. CCGUVB4N]MCP3446440.1 GNAT family N-acetyltransferase [Bradyrhizobium sp. CCGUVB14]